MNNQVALQGPEHPKSHSEPLPSLNGGKKNQPQTCDGKFPLSQVDQESERSGFSLVPGSYYLYDWGQVILISLSLSCLPSKMRKEFPLLLYCWKDYVMLQIDCQRGTQ